MFYLRLTSLCNERGVKITNVVSELKMGSGNLSNWKSGRMPRGESLSKLADYFHVSTDYLLGRTDDPRPVGEMEGAIPVTERGPLYPPEYDLLSPEDQELVDNMIRSLAKKQQAAPAVYYIPPKQKTDSEMAQSDEDIDREVEDYRRRLIIEKSQEVGSSPSNGAGSETA